MPSRRQFLQAGLTGALALPVAGVRASLCSAAPVSASSSARFSKAIFDTRFPASVSFANVLERRGVPKHGIAGDVTALWYHDLYFRWQSDPAPITGMTTVESLFCLEVLARDAGLRVTERIEGDDGLVTWVISRPQASGPRPQKS